MLRGAVVRCLYTFVVDVTAVLCTVAAVLPSLLVLDVICANDRRGGIAATVGGGR